MFTALAPVPVTIVETAYPSLEYPKPDQNDNADGH